MNFFTAVVERREGGLVAVVADVVLPLSAASLIDDFGEWVGRTIIVGVRAESVTAAPRHEGSPRLVGTVEFVEELGSEVIVHARVPGLGSSAQVGVARATHDDHEIAPIVSNLVTKLPAHSSCRPGDTVTLFIDPANIHCFDPAGPSLRMGTRP